MNISGNKLVTRQTRLIIQSVCLLACLLGNLLLGGVLDRFFQRRQGGRGFDAGRACFHQALAQKGHCFFIGVGELFLAGEKPEFFGDLGFPGQGGTELFLQGLLALVEGIGAGVLSLENLFADIIEIG